MNDTELDILDLAGHIMFPRLLRSDGSETSGKLEYVRHACFFDRVEPMGPTCSPIPANCLICQSMCQLCLP